ncbi:DUF2911 domain-containing protein [Mucilaginibacter lappiensis]|uniref:DUF2911 domain-containing protein n=1 Tax=Mucilaginibacter lappiensis TaxID=354630 RepID=A0A841JJN8_9SPHI|nr:DUF2911 domain-containing protein [Mucilaginibacter lappiensis]MBB6131190.1 hypothetical protein [Mucilaginibacter lappiensis]
MRRLLQFKAGLLFAFMLLTSVAFAQDKKPMASPRDSVSGKVAGSTLTINYGSPSVKGRKIWGGLEPWGKVWRAGANEATTFTTTKAIKVEGKELAAGTYGFFLLPNENDTWAVIFNKVAKQWGAFKYDEKQDALRVNVKIKKTAAHERLVYTISAKGFSLLWDTTEVPVSVK